MTFAHDGGELSARPRPVSGVPSLVLGSSTQARLVAPGGVTDGEFGLFEWNMPAGSGGADAHFHMSFSESFYIISGTVELYDGARWLPAAAGDFLYVPRRGVHGFRNNSAAPASMLILFAPGPPRERYFEELAQISASGRMLSDEEWIELWGQHDQYPAGPR